MGVADLLELRQVLSGLQIHVPDCLGRNRGAAEAIEQNEKKPLHAGMSRMFSKRFLLLQGRGCNVVICHWFAFWFVFISLSRLRHCTVASQKVLDRSAEHLAFTLQLFLAPL